jgi:hypothetical protein
LSLGKFEYLAFIGFVGVLTAGGFFILLYFLDCFKEEDKMLVQKAISKVIK